MKLPKQLQNREFRFVLIKKGTKEPYETKWQQYNNYVFFHSSMTKSENAGVLCGKGGLIVLDIDDINLVEEFDNKCDTFSVKTGSGKRHYYFICKEKFERSYYVLKDGAGELRTKSSQVLIPNSLHPNGKRYEVFNDKEIRVIDKKEIREMLGDLLSKNGKTTDTTRSGKEWAEICSMIAGGYSFDECDREMRLLGFTKWIEEKQEYRIGTYCSALRTIKSESV